MTTMSSALTILKLCNELLILKKLLSDKIHSTENTHINVQIHMINLQTISGGSRAIPLGPQLGRVTLSQNLLNKP